jgi:hypothetical protein
MSLFFHEFQQNSQFLRPISLSNESDLGRVAYNHEYTCTQIYIKISSFKSLIYINYFYIFSDTENSSKMKTVQKRNTDEEKDRSQSRVNVAYNNGADEY